MRASDITKVVALSEQIHPELPESHEVQFQRRAIYPEGCFVLESRDEILGYVFSHPIVPYAPPALNAPPPPISRAHTQLYLHDIVVAPEMRGHGQAKAGIEQVLKLATQFKSMALISVYGTQSFWIRFGFKAFELPDREKLASYGGDASFMVRTC